MRLKKYLPDIFEFYLQLIFFELHISLLKEHVYQDIFTFLRIELRLWKFRHAFNLGRTRHAEFWNKYGK